MHYYTILIPIFNERRYIPSLLSNLYKYSKQGHHIIIIDDGSNDGSRDILANCEFIKLIQIKHNLGKGNAIKEGLRKVKTEKVLIYDGDMELNPNEISKLMILDRKKGLNGAMGYRFKSLNPFISSFGWGNFIFSSFFNIIFNTLHKDILCCAKSFFVNDIKVNYLESSGFDIDVELSFFISKANKENKIPQVKLNYKRRGLKEGKKLIISDGWKILGRVLSLLKYV